MDFSNQNPFENSEKCRDAMHMKDEHYASIFFNPNFLNLGCYINLVMKEQFSGVSTDDAASHLNNFVELCEMQKYKRSEERRVGKEC